MSKKLETFIGHSWLTELGGRRSPVTPPPRRAVGSPVSTTLSEKYKKERFINPTEAGMYFALLLLNQIM